jgi:hypothetical protein
MGVRLIPNSLLKRCLSWIHPTSRFGSSVAGGSTSAGASRCSPLAARHIGTLGTLAADRDALLRRRNSWLDPREADQLGRPASQNVSFQPPLPSPALANLTRDPLDATADCGDETMLGRLGDDAAARNQRHSDAASSSATFAVAIDFVQPDFDLRDARCEPADREIQSPRDQFFDAGPDTLALTVHKNVHC